MLSFPVQLRSSGIKQVGFFSPVLGSRLLSFTDIWMLSLKIKGDPFRKKKKFLIEDIIFTKSTAFFEEAATY